jgi:hypothetical protein
MTCIKKYKNVEAVERDLRAATAVSCKNFWTMNVDHLSPSLMTSFPVRIVIAACQGDDVVCEIWHNVIIFRFVLTTYIL